MDSRLQDPTDPLSPLGRRLLKLDPQAYGILVPQEAGNAIARDHIVSERTVRESSVPFTFIRQKTPKCAPISMSVAGSRR